jgi:hypothetical protein
VSGKVRRRSCVKTNPGAKFYSGQPTILEFLDICGQERGQASAGHDAQESLRQDAELGFDMGRRRHARAIKQFVAFKLREVNFEVDFPAILETWRGSGRES